VASADPNKRAALIDELIARPVANTAPGIFTPDSPGTHDGAILHGDCNVVNASGPAVRRETVSMYLTGTGPMTTPVADGFGATAVSDG
jgi:uncharacterized protein (TIGR03437 family)